MKKERSTIFLSTAEQFERALNIEYAGWEMKGSGLDDKGWWAIMERDVPEVIEDEKVSDYDLISSFRAGAIYADFMVTKHNHISPAMYYVTVDLFKCRDNGDGEDYYINVRGVLGEKGSVPPKGIDRIIDVQFWVARDNDDVVEYLKRLDDASYCENDVFGFSLNERNQVTYVGVCSKLPECTTYLEG